MQIITNSNTYIAEIQKDNSILLNDKKIDLDLQKLSEREFHLLKNNQSFNIETLKVDYQNKEFEIKINGKIHSLKAKDRMNLLLESLGMENVSAAKAIDLKAPMPGLVLDILVEEGTTIEKGTPLMILEAMKMENVLKATGEATIKNISVSKGQNVEKNAVLIEFE